MLKLGFNSDCLGLAASFHKKTVAFDHRDPPDAKTPISEPLHNFISPFINSSSIAPYTNSSPMRGSRMDKCCVLEEPIEREILTRCILRLQVVLPRDRSQHNPPRVTKRRFLSPFSTVDHDQYGPILCAGFPSRVPGEYLVHREKII